MVEGLEEATIRAVCFHGRRERNRGGDFLLIAQLLGRVAEKAGFFAQVRTPGRPQPPGSPDRVVARLSLTPFQDLDVPWRFHLEVVTDPRLLVVPPMGNALLPGGRILVNAPSLFMVPINGPPIYFADFSALAGAHEGTLPVALLAGTCAALGKVAPEMSLGIEVVELVLCGDEGRVGDFNAPELIRAAFEAVKSAGPSVS